MLNQRSLSLTNLLPVKFRTRDSQCDSEHSDKESRDYLPSNSCKNLSEDDSESTDNDGFD